MYSIKITVKMPISKKQKDILFQSSAEVKADCSVKGTSCEIDGSSDDLEKLSYLLGVALGSDSMNEIIKLLVSYEKSADKVSSSDQSDNCL